MAAIDLDKDSNPGPLTVSKHYGLEHDSDDLREKHRWHETEDSAKRLESYLQSPVITIPHAASSAQSLEFSSSPDRATSRAMAANASAVEDDNILMYQAAALDSDRDPRRALHLLAELAGPRQEAQRQRETVVSEIERILDSLSAIADDQKKSKLQYIDSSIQTTRKEISLVKRMNQTLSVKEAEITRRLQSDSGCSPGTVPYRDSAVHSEVCSATEDLPALGASAKEPDDDGRIDIVLSFQEESQLEDDLIEIGHKQDVLMTKAIEEAGTSDIAPEALRKLDDLDDERDLIITKLKKVRRMREKAMHPRYMPLTASQSIKTSSTSFPIARSSLSQSSSGVFLFDEGYSAEVSFGTAAALTSEG